MPNNGPPKHRHDGTSPLPLGMDWSPPPKRWEGRHTIWPHNPQTGWSYCVMLPSWIVQAEPGEALLNPVVGLVMSFFIHDMITKKIPISMLNLDRLFYRINVGVQSPDGVSASHGLLKRFSDFLKLYSVLKKEFPRKSIPPSPPKHVFLKINSSRVLLEERRHALEEWMGKLLSDIDLSRSAPVAGFLELEAAARSFYSASQDGRDNSLETSSSMEAIGAVSPFSARQHSIASVSCSSAVESKSHSVASDVGSEMADMSDLGTPRHETVQFYESSVEDLGTIQDSMTSIRVVGNDNLGIAVWDQPEGFLRSKMNYRKKEPAIEGESFDGDFQNIDVYDEKTQLKSVHNLVGHSSLVRKLSAESIGSETSSIKGSEISVAGVSNSLWDSSITALGGVDVPNAIDAVATLENRLPNESQIVLRLDQKHKLNRILLTMQRRLTTAKTDMEDLIVRLNQEMAVKEYLKTKVKVLEVELEDTKQKGRENLQQAILIERERITQMQWDMDELRRKCSEMESKLSLQQNEKACGESEKITSDDKKDLMQALSSKHEELLKMHKRLEEVESKSKADIKLLVKEVKSLRNSQVELKKALNQVAKEKAELEQAICEETERSAHAISSKEKLLNECRVLYNRLQECDVNFQGEGEDEMKITSSSLSDALDLLETSDNRISLLLAEVQLLARDDDHSGCDANLMENSEPAGSSNSINGDRPFSIDDDIRKMLADIIVDNARLRKQVNSVIRRSLNTATNLERKDSAEVPSRNTVCS